MAQLTLNQDTRIAMVVDTIKQYTGFNLDRSQVDIWLNMKEEDFLTPTGFGNLKLAMGINGWRDSDKERGRGHHGWIELQVPTTIAKDGVDRVKVFNNTLLNRTSDIESLGFEIMEKIHTPVGRSRKPIECYALYKIFQTVCEDEFFRYLIKFGEQLKKLLDLFVPEYIRAMTVAKHMASPLLTSTTPTTTLNTTGTMIYRDPNLPQRRADVDNIGRHTYYPNHEGRGWSGYRRHGVTSKGYQNDNDFDTYFDTHKNASGGVPRAVLENYKSSVGQWNGKRMVRCGLKEGWLIAK